MSSATRTTATTQGPAEPATAEAGARWTRRLAETPEIGVVLACVVVFVAVYIDKHSFANTGNLQEMGRNLLPCSLMAWFAITTHRRI